MVEFIMLGSMHLSVQVTDACGLHEAVYSFNQGMVVYYTALTNEINF